MLKESKVKERDRMFISVDKLFRLFDRMYPKLTAYYQRLRLIITKDTDAYWETSHFYRKKRGGVKERYCIFRMSYPGYALFATARQYVFMYEWAVNKGFIPLVDMEYEHSFDQHKIGEDNKWEYCFKQPISVSEAKEKDCVYLRLPNGNTYLQKTCMDINGKKDDIYIHITEENWREYYANINKYVKKCWTFKQELLDSYEREYGSKMQKGHKVLGVFLRETFSEEFFKHLNDFEKGIYGKHPKNPDIDTTINIVKEYMLKWKCDIIFLSTVYQDSVDRFQEIFGSKIVVVERFREVSVKDVLIVRGKGFDSTAKEMYQQGQRVDHKERLTSYTKEVIALSRCDYLIAAKGAGAAAALSLNGGKYKDIHILEDKNKSSWY